MLIPPQSPPILRCSCGGFGIVDKQEWCFVCGVPLVMFPKHGDPNARVDERVRAQATCFS